MTFRDMEWPTPVRPEDSTDALTLYKTAFDAWQDAQYAAFRVEASLPRLREIERRLKWLLECQRQELETMAKLGR